MLLKVESQSHGGGTDGKVDATVQRARVSVLAKRWGSQQVCRRATMDAVAKEEVAVLKAKTT